MRHKAPAPRNLEDDFLGGGNAIAAPNKFCVIEIELIDDGLAVSFERLITLKAGNVVNFLIQESYI